MNCITDVVTEMPRSFSIAIQSEAAWRLDFRALTVPASCKALPNSSSFSVTVVLPASGCEMMAKVRRRETSSASFDSVASQLESTARDALAAMRDDGQIQAS